ncbi:protein kinase domain-containing protein [Citrus sinensis]|nr:protein kinase domain-containing protein [Citrus sinensis]
MADGQSSKQAAILNKQEDDVFLVHPSDSPTAVLVSHLLTGDNYGTWVRAMTMALRSKNELGFVDGTISKPDEDEDNGGRWQRCNDLVGSWVLNSISNELAGSVLYAQSAREVVYILRILQDLYTKKHIGKGRLREGLFYIQLLVAFSFTSQITSTHEIDLWHWRLGHPSLGRLEHFSKTCPMSNTLLSPFPNENISSSHALHERGPPLQDTNPSVTNCHSPDTTHEHIITETSSTQQPSSATLDSSLSLGNQNIQTPTRTQRDRRPPTYLQDYCTLASHKSTHADLVSSSPGKKYPLHNFISYHRFSPAHKSFLSDITSTTEPSFFHEAVKLPECRKAMEDEITALEKNNTWTLTHLPDGKKAIGSRWVYKIKYQSDGTIEHYKARLVAKGYTQTEGIDYHATFSPVAKLVTVRALLSLAAIKARNDAAEVSRIKDFLAQKFYIKALAKLKYFLGIEVARSSRGIFLSQRKYVLDILKDAGLLAGRVSHFPMEQQLRLSSTDGDLLPNPSSYRRLIGSPGKGILLSSISNLHIRGYCDTDWGSCPTTRRSVTGYCTFLGDSPISWKTKKQNVVSRSTAEAEYRSLADLSCELQWLKALFADLGHLQHDPMTVICDNQSALYITENHVYHERTKHIELDFHFMRERVQSNLLLPLHIPTSMQAADVFTKPLGHALSIIIYASWALSISTLHLEGEY